MRPTLEAETSGNCLTRTSRPMAFNRCSDALSMCVEVSIQLSAAHGPFFPGPTDDPCCLSRDSCHTLGDLKRVTDVTSARDPSPSDLDLDPRHVVVRGREPFGDFYERERRAMVALAYATSRSRLAAEDIAQDAFMAAFREWERVGRLDNPATWVRRVVINRSVSVIRRRITAARHVARLGGSVNRLDLPAVSAETEHLWVAVRRLPKRQRQVIALRYVDQLTLAEIGDVLGCSKESVNTHLRRARSTLARRVGTQEET